MRHNKALISLFLGGVYLRYYLISFLIGASLLIPKDALANCGWGGPFLENVEQADLIVRGKILAYHERLLLSSPLPSLDVDVLEIYKGAFGDSQIRIVDDPLFGAFLTDFPVGTEWILALVGQKSRYNIRGCWNSYLKVEASVVGNLNNTEKYNAQQRIGLDEFRNLLAGTGSPQLFTYDNGVLAGRQQCIDDPASCGINISGCSRETLYDATTGKLYIPCVNVHDASGNVTVYEATLNQRFPSLTFDLDDKSVKAH